MINILLTSKNSFLSKEISKNLANCNFFYITRENLLNVLDLKNIVLNNNIDYIIHTSWAGVGAGTFSDYVFNLSVHENVKLISNLVKKIFIFGSGCEFYSTDKVKESELNLIRNKSYYADCKNKISLDSRKLNNFVNFRLFGCFGEQENNSRFIKRSMLNLGLGKDIVIHKNKEMDFFYVGDLIYLLENFINEKYKINLKEINCVYKKKYKLSEIAEFLIKKYSPNSSIEIIEQGYDDPYTGCSDLIDSLNLNFKGLHSGILEIYGH